MSIAGIIHFRFAHRKSWNCDRFCETEQELNEWLDHEQNVGNNIRKIGPNEYIVKIED